MLACFCSRARPGKAAYEALPEEAKMQNGAAAKHDDAPLPPKASAQGDSRPPQAPSATSRQKAAEALLGSKATPLTRSNTYQGALTARDEEHPPMLRKRSNSFSDLNTPRSILKRPSLSDVTKPDMLRTNSASRVRFSGLGAGARVEAAVPADQPSDAPQARALPNGAAAKQPSPSASPPPPQQQQQQQQQSPPQPPPPPSAAASGDALSSSSGRLSDKYEMTDEVLGQGAFGMVKLARSKDGKEEFAVKIISKTNQVIKNHDFMEEVNILSRSRHPHIIALHDKYETEQNLYLVMELARGGELFDRIIAERTFDERFVARVAAQILDALSYLHSMGITHRDIKPENILFKDASPDSPIKITDFGFAKRLQNKEDELRVKAKRGTMGYAAPEIFSGNRYDEKCDVWSVGVVLYIMLCGVPPFCDVSGFTPEELAKMPFWRHAQRMAKVPSEPVQFPAALWRGVSDSARQFLSLALEVNPAKRARAIDLLKHAWLKAASKLLTATTVVDELQGAAAPNKALAYRSLR